MRGIILAGGSGTRLYPLTRSISKQLLPVYDKPMIYYPLSVLMLAGITEILVISTERDTPLLEDLLKDGKKIGLKISYKIQENPNGIAEAFIIGREFIGNDDVCLILGDNIFYGHSFPEKLSKAIKIVKQGNAVIFAYHVKNPQDYGVVEFDKNNCVYAISEKPKKPMSNYAITGLYFYPNNIIEKAPKVSPSDRGELEITSINQLYLKEKKLLCETLGRGIAWLDAGSHQNLLDASIFIEAIESRQGLKVAASEEIAAIKGYISYEDLSILAKEQEASQYGQYLHNIYMNHKNESN